MQQQNIEIEAVSTPLGYVYGRDAVYVDRLDYELERRHVTLVGEFNGTLASKSESDDFVKYTLCFEGVYYFNAMELDLHGDYLPIGKTDIKSDWLEYRQSPLLERAKQKAKRELKELRHFILFTYDNVFEIACQNYTLELHVDEQNAE
ncbi:hypothetical protein SK066_15475 [Paenibacillus hunanensis]|uniref:hypothetical protein n=1 Tax=Paenibacillus hunanensis TaxID=539262 RepID=UPI002A69931F|nr:hypothetical protein [Paenibacillus hunanensis]WPP40011.1 hypothetical protein SK066_15475 [Paenibacillus hunanensis]